MEFVRAPYGITNTHSKVCRLSTCYGQFVPACFFGNWSVDAERLPKRYGVSGSHWRIVLSQNFRIDEINFLGKNLSRRVEVASPTRRLDSGAVRISVRQLLS